nr:hypothetical protein StreXyl84_59350 [Streptomyces sp. Xyl84]
MDSTSRAVPASPDRPLSWPPCAPHADAPPPSPVDGGRGAPLLRPWGAGAGDGVPGPSARGNAAVPAVPVPRGIPGL